MFRIKYETLKGKPRFSFVAKNIIIKCLKIVVMILQEVLHMMDQEQVLDMAIPWQWRS